MNKGNAIEHCGFVSKMIRLPKKGNAIKLRGVFPPN
jgi:hypothetical protein